MVQPPSRTDIQPKPLSTLHHIHIPEYLDTTRKEPHVPSVPCGDETKNVSVQWTMFKSWRIASRIISVRTRLWNSGQRLKNQKSNLHVRWSKAYLFPIHPHTGSAPLDRFGMCVRLSLSEPQTLYSTPYTNHCSTHGKSFQ